MKARRFSFAPLVFFALWALWFALPVTRDAARAGWKARFSGNTSATPAPVEGNSRDAQFVRALDASIGSKRGPLLESLSRKFPRDAAICAAQVVRQSQSLHLDGRRQPGPSSNLDLNWSVKLAKVEPASPADLREYFAATARGAALEPNNTFWDWAQIMGLLAANRDDEVWPVLRAASRKTGYDDHTSEGALARLRGQSAIGPMSLLSQVSIAAQILFPHFATMREAVRQLSDDASGLRLSGEAAKQKQALEGMRDLVFLARTMRLQSKDFIGSLVGQAMESIAFWGGSYSPTRPRFVKHPLPGSAAYASDPRSLLVFAGNLKRPDVAAQLGGEWKAAGAWRAKTKPLAGQTFLVGVSPRDFWWAMAGDWFGALLLASIAPLLAWALATALLLRLVPAWRRESPTVLSGASWGTGAVLTLLATGVLLSIVLRNVVVAAKTSGLSFGDWLLAVGSQSADLPLVPPAWQAFSPAIAGALLALHLAGAWNNRQIGHPSLGARLRHILHPPDDQVARFDLSPLLALAATLTACFVGTVGVLAYLVVPVVNSDFASYHDYAGWALAGFAILLALPALSNLRSATGLGFALGLARRFAWAQLIFVSLLWGLLWMLAAPAQKRFDTQFTRQLQVGEFQLARRKLGI